MTAKGKTNPRRTNTTQRDNVRRRVLAEESICWICGRTVDKSLKTPHPGSPEVDEIIPVSKGGSPYERNNCHLAHRSCNRARGNGDYQRSHVDGLTTSRQWSDKGR